MAVIVVDIQPYMGRLDARQQVVSRGYGADPRTLGEQGWGFRHGGKVGAIGGNQPLHFTSTNGIVAVKGPDRYAIQMIKAMEVKDYGAILVAAGPDISGIRQSMGSG
ncbi:MAG: hypothetical protein BWY71_02160 [Planctomycetes bacterium ADurb.Bin412]|nr:MAG: hypothetical protein BWY71_02160 [Planctomycetes bacterium ADurb.Bin412]